MPGGIKVLAVWPTVLASQWRELGSLSVLPGDNECLGQLGLHHCPVGAWPEPTPVVLGLSLCSESRLPGTGSAGDEVPLAVLGAGMSSWVLLWPPQGTDWGENRDWAGVHLLC